ncbi:MAG TPA: hypothetical protein VE053_02155 [Allosphingosinicella sp.]|nr:hypothetical protein [Allosphingosinicella sp.]
MAFMAFVFFVRTHSGRDRGKVAGDLSQQLDGPKAGSVHPKHQRPKEPAPGKARCE